MRQDVNVNLYAPGENVLKIVELSPSDLDRDPLVRQVFDLTSFVTYLKRWGDALTASMFFTKEGVVCLMNDRADRRNGTKQDSLSFGFTRPTVAKKWLAIFGKGMNHKAFREFLELRFAEVTGGADLFAKISNLSIAKSFQYDATMNNAHSYKIGFTSDAGGDVATLPKFVTIQLPLIDGLDTVYTLTAKLDLVIPTSEGQSPTFTLTVDDLEDVFEQAAKDAMTKVAEDLPDYLIVHGQAGGQSSPF